MSAPYESPRFAKTLNHTKCVMLSIVTKQAWGVPVIAPSSVSSGHNYRNPIAISGHMLFRTYPMLFDCLVEHLDHARTSNQDLNIQAHPQHHMLFYINLLI